MPTSIFIPIQAVALLLFLATLLLSSAATAHGRSVSYSSWDIDASGAHVSVRLKLLELSRIGPEALPPGTISGAAPIGSPDLPARAFPAELVLFANEAPCLPTAVAARRPDQPGWVRYEWRVECPQAEAERLTIQSQILLAVAPSHMHFARARFANAPEALREQVLTEATPRFVVRDLRAGAENQAATGSRFIDYFTLGIEHIMSGWDHLAFVFGLLLLATRLGDVARLVTGFTLAHSLTLALAVLELVHPRAAAVEAVIAFSVALVAIEKGWILADRPRAIPLIVLGSLAALAGATLSGYASLSLLTTGGLMLFTACYFALVARHSGEWLRVCLTFAFGLVHGFGFAGILVEMTLPADRLVPALLGFNLGVEAGQIAVVLAFWPLLWAGRRFASETAKRWGGELAAAGLCGLGVFWLVERVFSAYTTPGYVLAASERRSRLKFPRHPTDTFLTPLYLRGDGEQLACNRVAMANSLIGRLTIWAGTGPTVEATIDAIARRVPFAAGSLHSDALPDGAQRTKRATSIAIHDETSGSS